MKPNCFFLRLDRSKMKLSGGQRFEETSKLRPLKNGYYRVQMGLARDFLSSVLLQIKQLNRVLYASWCSCFGFKWKSWLTVSDDLVT